MWDALVHPCAIRRFEVFQRLNETQRIAKGGSTILAGSQCEERAVGGPERTALHRIIASILAAPGLKPFYNSRTIAIGSHG